jgi:hypothetical protein
MSNGVITLLPSFTDRGSPPPVACVTPDPAR